MADSTKTQTHIIMTGGTIDGVWDSSQDSIVIADRSVLQEYFEKLKKHIVFAEELLFTEVCVKDSRAITEEDRNNVLKTIEESPAKRIIITHGTFTIPETAKFLDKKLKRRDQTIILTGSLVPLKGFEFSDGPFNIGYAFAHAQSLPPGIYVCMNTRLFTLEELAKDISDAKFYSVFKEEQ